MDQTLIYLLVAAGVVFLVGAVFYTVRRRRGPEALPKPASPPILDAPAGTLADRLVKTRSSLGSRLREAFSASDDDVFDGMEEALIGADLGVAATTSVVDAVRSQKPATPDEAKSALRNELLGTLADKDRTIQRTSSPAVIVVVGVNGVGKTTTIAKLAARLREDDVSTILGAADTFRAAADTQLRTWADRVGVDVITAAAGSDPASVAHDAVQAAKSRGRDSVIIDTAGRLHSKSNLMAELTKIVRVVTKEAGRIDEVLLVLDATTGQNGLAQAKQFTEAVGVTGIVLTKMDGTARGGIVIAVERELGIPVKFIGVGEGVDDLVRFEPAEFVDALLADA